MFKRKANPRIFSVSILRLKNEQCFATEDKLQQPHSPRGCRYSEPIDEGKSGQVHGELLIIHRYVGLTPSLGLD